RRGHPSMPPTKSYRPRAAPTTARPVTRLHRLEFPVDDLLDCPRARQELLARDPRARAVAGRFECGDVDITHVRRRGQGSPARYPPAHSERLDQLREVERQAARFAGTCSIVDADPPHAVTRCLSGA